MGELHRRLSRLSLGAPPHDDVFTSRTRVLVEGFQRSRGLPLTGVVDETTWERLDEATWRFGDRLLYLASPFLRGDDVAQLQVYLAQLGFNPGRIDGIFGPLLDRALREFQENSGVDVSGTMTRATIHELRRLGGSDERRLVTDARNIEEQGASQEIVLWGDSPLVDEIAANLRAYFDVHVARASDAHELATLANDGGVALVLSLARLESVNGIHLHYWAGYRTHSRRGEQLASAIAASLAASASAPRVEVTGMALPILRETQMTTLHVEFGEVSDQVRHQVVTAIAINVRRVIHRSNEK